MQDIKFYELSYNSDCVEGRGYNKIHARFANKDDAITICNDQKFWKRYGVMGTKIDPAHHVKEVVGIVFESVSEYLNYDENAIKEAALAKLTDIEKKLLGLI